MEKLNGISPTQLEQLRGYIAQGEPGRFYDTAAWRRMRALVFKLDRRECQHCKARGRYSAARVVHHVKHLSDRPDLALSVYDGAERQLVSLCKTCHEAEHPEALGMMKEDPVTVERWD